MNILWINHEYPPIGGGGATTCRALSREFAKAGHKVTVVTAGFTGAPEGTAGRARNEGWFETVDGVNICRLKCKRSTKDQSSFFEMLSFLFAAFRFVPKLIKDGRFDIVYIFFGIPSGPLGWYLKKRFRIPYIVCLGGGDVPGTQERFKAAYFMLGPALKSVWRNAKCVVANSQGLRERAERFYDKARFAVINNGVDFKDFGSENGENGMRSAKTAAGDVGDSFRIVTTARILERKGIQHVVEALPKLVEESNGNIRYTVIGDGPYRKEIEALAAKLGVAEYVEITGMMPYGDYLKKLREADVFALTSHWEGMPNAVTEAMALRLPVIMSDCEGSAELVDGNGFIIERGEGIADRFTEKILLLYNDRTLTAELGNKSYGLICERFLWEKSAARFLELAEI